MRIVWFASGLLALILGLIGVALPLLPTVPFLLLAAFCFARSSATLHDWLVHHPKLGPPIHDWNENGSVSKAAKIYATVSVTLAMALSVSLGLKPTILGVQAIALLCVMFFLWTRPSA